jgi:ketosteroid isomerase-like protein
VLRRARLRCPATETRQKHGYKTMNKNIWATRLFQAIDNKDTEAFAAFLAADVQFRFGNADPVHGKAAVRTAVNAFFDSVKGMRHVLDKVWEIDGQVICHGTVTYTRHDSTTLSVPFANILTLRDELVAQYLIFVDVSALYASA